MRPWAEDLLDRSRMRQDGLFDADVVYRRWEQHLRRESDATPELWAVLMYQAWATENAAS
jgi:asparagine synthase (glutamine-hydrolysing)